MAKIVFSNGSDFRAPKLMFRADGIPASTRLSQPQRTGLGCERSRPNETKQAKGPNTGFAEVVRYF